MFFAQKTDNLRRGKMDWITNIQKAIDYVEEHIEEKIDFEKVAHEACSSSFHFQRIFSAICGISLGEYIRNRRLSLAAEFLSGKNSKVIDTAFRFGYETPESFTRAFTRFHGITPNEAKRGGKIKTFSRLSVKLILIGGKSMNYRIEKLDSFKILCKRKSVKKPTGMQNDALLEIKDFWAECEKDGTTQKIISCFPNKNLKGLLGISFSSEIDGAKFPYGIGVEYDGRKIPEGLEVVEIPASTFAVFTCHGKMPEAFNETYTKICSEFFPQSTKYEYAYGVELEVYPSEDVQNPDYECEIWIAVKEK